MKIGMLIKVKGILNMHNFLVAILILIRSGLFHADQSRYVLSDDKELCEIASL